MAVTDQSRKDRNAPFGYRAPLPGGGSRVPVGPNRPVQVRRMACFDGGRRTFGVVVFTRGSDALKLTKSGGGRGQVERSTTRATRLGRSRSMAGVPLIRIHGKPTSSPAGLF